MALVLDTSPLLAALDAADPDHRSCAELLKESDEELVVPALVLSELDYWCHERLTGEVWLAFLQDVLDGAYRIEHPTTADLERCVELQRTYADLRVGVVLACWLSSSVWASRSSQPSTTAISPRCGPVTSKQWNCCRRAPESPRRQTEPPDLCASSARISRLRPETPGRNQL